MFVGHLKIQNSFSSSSGNGFDIDGIEWVGSKDNIGFINVRHKEAAHKVSVGGIDHTIDEEVSAQIAELVLVWVRCLVGDGAVVLCWSPQLNASHGESFQDHFGSVTIFLLVSVVPSGSLRVFCIKLSIVA